MRVTRIISACVLVWLTAVETHARSTGQLPAMIYAPTPEYPTQAAMYHTSAKGVFVLRVQIRTGAVKEVLVEQSTGWSILDGVAKRTLMQWRFKPGPSNLPPIKIESPHLKDRSATEDSFVRVPVHFLTFGGRNA
jgi:Gram-negative bacterial TonB protein C-terminal